MGQVFLDGPDTWTHTCLACFVLYFKKFFIFIFPYILHFNSFKYICGMLDQNIFSFILDKLK